MYCYLVSHLVIYTININCKYVRCCMRKSCTQLDYSCNTIFFCDYCGVIVNQYTFHNLQYFIFSGLNNMYKNIIKLLQFFEMLTVIKPIWKRYSYSYIYRYGWKFYKNIHSLIKGIPFNRPHNFQWILQISPFGQ